MRIEELLNANYDSFSENERYICHYLTVTYTKYHFPYKRQNDIIRYICFSIVFINYRVLYKKHLTRFFVLL